MAWAFQENQWAEEVLTLTVVLLKEQLDKFGVRYPKSGPNSLKPNLQVILTDHLKENEVFFAYEGGGGGFLGIGCSCRLHLIFVRSTALLF